ncbi:hypothetical protein [Mongoliitalea lutea]|uniref:Uncharacterized protein n=1 Tax=Mongoliitalea lutea TaxID=849756 RepID=A0A8J3CXZ5_9BACT|nr:hypothetical protein [Mongoliitalea lutea]GHB35273.1 hypothetical protein GCM10008106_15850 [Mongoliitalea lutea]
MKSLLLSLLLVVLVSLSAFSQIANLNLNGAPARLNAYNNIDGSPYLFEQWKNAGLFDKNGKLLKENVSLKINTYEDELEMLTDSGNRIFLDKTLISSVTMDAMLGEAERVAGALNVLTFKKGFSNINGVNEDSFINVLSEGDAYTVVRRFKTNLVEPPRNSYTPNPGKSFIMDETFYLINSNSEVSSFKNRSASVLKALDPDDKILAKNIIKNYKLDVSRDDHLKQLFDYLNEEKK